MFSKMIEAGIGLAIRVPVLKLTGCKPGTPISEALTHHFIGKRIQLGEGFQNAYEQAMLAIAGGLAPKEWWNLTDVLQSNVAKEFANSYVEPRISSFCSALNQKELIQFRKAASQACQEAAEQKETLFPIEQFEEFDFVSMLNQQIDHTQLQRTIFTSIIQVSGIKSHPLILDFLRHDQLLLEAIFQFFREELLKNKELNAVFSLLKQEGIQVDLNLLQASQEQIHQMLNNRLQDIDQKLSQLAMMRQSAVAIPMMQAQIDTQSRSYQEEQQNVQGQLQNMGQVFAEAKAEWSQFGEDFERDRATFQSWRQECGGQLEHIRTSLTKLHTYLEEQLTTITGGIEELKQMVTELLNRNQQLTPQLSINSFSMLLPQDDIQRIQAAEEKLKALPLEDHRYSEYAIKVASFLASIGGLQKAEHFFLTAKESAHTNNNTINEALALNNLFHLYIQQLAYQKALDSYRNAVRLNPQAHMLFPKESYHPLKILGAGGMGCAFLCEEPYTQQQVVVKTFWEEAKTHHSYDEVFQEAKFMSGVDREGEFVPKVLTAGYVNNFTRERPYIAMQYIENAMDGEVYIREHGSLSWSEGLEVGLKVAKALQKAHQKQICHFDLKPANLLLKRTEEGDFDVKIIDFGLARVASSFREELAQKGHSGRTVMQQNMFGTLEYAPPEQKGYPGIGKPGPHSDIFSFGATLYRLLTGKSPQFISPKKLAHTPPGFHVFLDACMEELPVQRLSSAEDVIERLEKLETEASQLPPLLRYLFEDVLEDQLLEDIEESSLWITARGRGYEREAFLALIAQEMNKTGSRRESAIRAEQWLQEQAPKKYFIHDIWSALCKMYPREYNEQGTNRSPQVTPVEHLNTDPAFAYDEHEHFWLKCWEPLPVETKEIDVPSSEETLQNTSLQTDFSEETNETQASTPPLSAGRLVRDLGLRYKVWTRILHPETGKPVSDETETQLIQSHPPKPIEITFTGRQKISKVREQLETLTGMRLEVLNTEGEPADAGSRFSTHRLLSGKWVMGMDQSIFFTLKPPSGKNVLGWRDSGYLQFGRLGETLFPEPENLPIRLRTERGEFSALLSCEQNGFRRLRTFFQAYPELRPGDVVCLIRHEHDLFDVELFWQDGIAPTSESLNREGEAHSESTIHVGSSPAQGTPSIEAIQTSTLPNQDTEDLAAQEELEAIEANPTTIELKAEIELEEEEDAEEASILAEVVETEIPEEDQEESDLTMPISSTEELPEELRIHRITVGRTIKEFALEYRLWINILDAEGTPATEETFLDTLQTETPQLDELYLHGAHKVKKAQKNIQKHLGCDIHILQPNGEVADSNTSLSKCWLRSGANLFIMGKSYFFTLKAPSSRSGVLSWRKHGYLKFGGLGAALFPEQKDSPITLEMNGETFEATLECKYNQFGKLKSLFRANPDWEPGDVVCFTQVEDEHFSVEYFVGNGEEEVESLEDSLEEELYEEQIEAEARAISRQNLPAHDTIQTPLSEEEREQYFQRLIIEANTLLEATRLEEALQIYNELHFNYPILLETDLDAYRRVASARFYQEGLEMLEDDPGFALRKMEGARAIDPGFLSDLVEVHIRKLQAHQQKQRKKRFSHLVQKACQTAQADPDEALELLSQAKRTAPKLWDERLDQWVDYAHKVKAYKAKQRVNVGA